MSATFQGSLYRLVQAVRRLITRVLWPTLPNRLGALEARTTNLEQVIGLEEESPVRAHIRESIKRLSLGVAAVYGGSVEGDIAEFGTMTGATAEGLARAISMADSQLGYALDIVGLPRKRLHLFDSFQGLPPADNAIDADAPHVRSGAWGPGTCVGLSRDQLQAKVGLVLDPGRIKIFAGWFSETLRTLPEGTKYALVHIDSDLYSSARDVLGHLFGNRMLANGAWVFFDDWNCNGASPELGERRAWRECVERYRVTASDEGGYGVFGHKFIVHGYQ